VVQAFSIEPSITQRIPGGHPHPLARVFNRLGLVVPVNGRTVSEANEHEWTEEFEVGPDGLITKIHVSALLKERRL
jgi:hypothetical protein